MPTYSPRQLPSVTLHTYHLLLSSKTISSAALIALMGLSGCGQDAIPQVPAHPLGDRYGEHYDLTKFEECHAKDPRDTSCEIYRLTRIDNPEVWPYPDVPPVKWPDPPKVSVYKPGMNGIDYWRALCKAEAGEFIYKRVEDVEGIYQIRPRKKESEYGMTDRYVMEDPYGYVDGEVGREGVFMFVGPPDIGPLSSPYYSYLESAPVDLSIPYYRRDEFNGSLFDPRPENARFQRFYGYDHGNQKKMRMKWTIDLDSKYGFTWQGISRQKDRELGVAGGETADVELATNKVIAIRRGFILANTYSNGGISWLTGNACPEYSKMEGLGARRRRNKDVDFTLWFLTKVLQPRGVVGRP